MWIKRIGLKTYGVFCHWHKGPIWTGNKRSCIINLRGIEAAEARTCDDEFRAGC